MAISLKSYETLQWYVRLSLMGQQSESITLERSVPTMASGWDWDLPQSPDNLEALKDMACSVDLGDTEVVVEQ